MGKIIALGPMNSGKTVCLVGMYRAMGNDVENFSLIAKDDGSDFCKILWDKMVQEGRPPYPTMKPEVHNFQLVYEFRPVCDIEWIEYGVDILPSEHQKFKNDAAETDCLFLFDDGEIFHIPNARNIDDYERKLLEKLKFNQGLNREFNCLAKVIVAGIELPPIAIVLTKADLIDPQYQEVVNSALHRKFATIFDAPNRLVLKVAVSLGGPIEPGFVPNPYYFEQLIIFSALTILLNQLERARILIKENADFIRNHFFGISKAKSHIELLKLQMADMVHFCQKLIGMFHANKVIYVDGVETNCRHYFETRLGAYYPAKI